MGNNTYRHSLAHTHSPFRVCVCVYKPAVAVSSKRCIEALNQKIMFVITTSLRCIEKMPRNLYFSDVRTPASRNLYFYISKLQITPSNECVVVVADNSLQLFQNVSHANLVIFGKLKKYVDISKWQLTYRCL